MKSKMNLVIGALLAMLLAACGSVDSASYMIAGAQHSLALTLTKVFAWDKERELTLVTARNPECMRKHKLQPVTGTEFKVELYRSLEGNYIIKQGSNWYVTETQKCRLQQFPTPPREPGDLLGVFEENEDGIKFVAAPGARSPAPAAILPAPATVQAPAQEAPPAVPPPASPAAPAQTR